MTNLMELGNMVFGHSRGRYAVPRDDDMWFQLKRLADATGQDAYFTNHIDNATFAVRSYCWNDCDCGYDERWSAKEADWLAAHPHADGCYQTELRAREAKWDAENGYKEIEAAAFGGPPSLLSRMDFETVDVGGLTVITGHSRPNDDAMARWREAHEKRQSFKADLYAELCARYKKPKFGCAVHCTCGHDKLWADFVDTDDHSPNCCIVLPNFHFKPTDFQLRWYKYPLRDSYSNARLTVSMLRKMVNECIRSLGKDPEDY